MTKKNYSASERPAGFTAENEARVACEAALLEAGRADIRAGRCIDDCYVGSWLEGLDGDEKLAVPERPTDMSYR